MAQPVPPPLRIGPYAYDSKFIVANVTFKLGYFTIKKQDILGVHKTFYVVCD